MTPLDAFNFGLDKVIRACEEKRLDPPADHTIQCIYCDGKGYYRQPHCAGATCTFLRRCGCSCQPCAMIACDACQGTGEMDEPEEWREDAYWEAAFDRDQEAKESGGAP